MYVKWLIGAVAQCRDHAGTKSHVRYEMPVHDIEMKPVCAIAYDGLNLFTHAREVGTENTRGNQGRFQLGHNLTFSLTRVCFKYSCAISLQKNHPCPPDRPTFLDGCEMSPVS